MTYNVSKLGIGVISLDTSTVRVRVEEEGGHVTLRAVRVLVLLSLLTLRLDHDFFRAEGINVVAITHGWVGGVVYSVVQMKSEEFYAKIEELRRQKISWRFHLGNKQKYSAPKKAPSRDGKGNGHLLLALQKRDLILRRNSI